MLLGYPGFDRGQREGICFSRVANLSWKLSVAWLSWVQKGQHEGIFFSRMAHLS